MAMFLFGLLAGAVCWWLGVFLSSVLITSEEDVVKAARNYWIAQGVVALVPLYLLLSCGLALGGGALLSLGLISAFVLYLNRGGREE